MCFLFELTYSLNISVDI